MAATQGSVGLVGLHNTATKNKLTDTVVPLWDLESTNDSIPAAESFNAVNPGAESVIGGDERVRVPKEHFAPGGKYRCTYLWTQLEQEQVLTGLHSYREALLAL